MDQRPIQLPVVGDTEIGAAAEAALPLRPAWEVTPFVLDDPPGDVPRFGEAAPAPRPDEELDRGARTDRRDVSPELALIDAELAETPTAEQDEPEVGSLPRDPGDADRNLGAMRNVPLGTLIIRAGLLAQEELEEALHEGSRTGKRLGEILADRGLINDEELGRLLAGQKGLPFLHLAGMRLDLPSVQLLSEEEARRQHALVIAHEDGVPVVCIADPSNEIVIETVRRALGTEPRVVVAARGDLDRKIDEAYAHLARPVPDTETTSLEAPVTDLAPDNQPSPVPAQPPAIVPPTEDRSFDPVPAPAPEPQVTPPAASVAQEQEPPVDTAPELAPVQLPVPAEAAPAPPAEHPVAEQAVVERPAPQVIEIVEPEPAAVETAPIAPSPIVEHLPEEPAREADPAPAPAPPAAIAQPEPPAVTPEPVQAPPAAEPEPQAAVPEPELETAPAASAVQAEPAPAEDAQNFHLVSVRLADGQQLEAGTFGSGGEAETHARELVAQIVQAESAAAWPFVAGRMLRPQTIVSVDVVEQST